ncbi:MAG: alpha/beta hydrolase family esterase [Burkholderiales bacterium]
MFQSAKRRLGSLVAVARRIILRFTGRRSGRWVEGSYAVPHSGFPFFPLPQSTRSYSLYIPGRYAATEKMPLLVMLHGCKQDPKTFASGTRMNLLADREGFVVLYPQQRLLANAYRCWNWFDHSAQRGDGEAALIAGMVREVTVAFALDPGRVYVAGISAGGAMASILACCYGHLFAACAVHSGLMYRAAESVTEAMRSMRYGSTASPRGTAQQVVAQKDFAFVPAMVIHGSADATVNPVNADQLVEQFTAIARLGDVGDTAVPKVTHSEAGEIRYAYEVRDYRQGGTLVLRRLLVEGLGHGWSGGDGEFPFNDPRGPDASRMTWEFVSEFERRERKIPAAVLTG